MAAKPPSKPPGNFLKQLNDCLSSGNNTPTKIFNKLSAHLKKNDTENTSNSGSTNSLAASNSNTNGNINEATATQLPLTASAASTTLTKTPPTSAPTTATAKKSATENCNCTNISIMHLFHEMKQEFPTIPDTIVAQCVNENCHQRENCIQQLQHELALHAIPLQTYPGKVLHPPSTSTTSSPLPSSTQQRKTSSGSVSELSPPLRPIRPAPVQPPLILQQQKQNCDSVNNNFRNNDLNCAKSPGFMRKDVKNSNNNRAATSDMPVTSYNNSCSNNNITNNNNNINNNSNNNNNNNYVSETQSNEIQNVALLSSSQQRPPSTTTTIVPRMRPTTLNLQQQQRQNQQQQQRQQINQQLQKHFQQRQQQQLLHQQHQQQQQQSQTKPLRKAPLPPLPPKPTQYVSAGAHSPQFHHQNNNNNNNSISSNFNGNQILVSSQRSSFSNDSSLTSPTSSVGESEISVNVSLSSPIVTTPPPSLAQQQQQLAVNAALRSPIRHRSVITVHPEPPYTRDFVNASASSPTTSSVGSNGGAPKSFTSVNLTLRQPNANSAVPPSTIDISAGPGLSGNGSGLTYSSTSYDARLGYQKNFHITVTDAGGVFSASRIRPRSCFVPETVNENEVPNSPNASSQVNPLRTATSEQCVSAQHKQQQQQQQNQQLHQQQQQRNILAAFNNAREMCLQEKNNEIIEILDRQKCRRDKLATALRDNKKRLNQVEQEINVLTEPIRPGENERLDEEIQKLRCDCEAMLNEIDISRRSDPSLANLNNRQLPSSATTTTIQQQQQQQQQQQMQMQTQPFPRQRSLRTTSTTSNNNASILTQRQPQLDFIQHHNTPTIPRTPALSSANSSHHQQQIPPPTYQEYYQQYQPRNPQLQQQQPFLHSTDEDEYSDSVTDDEDYAEEPLEMWACNMCTFQNHPQLNICECCENVRILPGTLRHIGVATAAIGAAASTISTPATSTNSNAAENDANLTPQQLQQFALPT